MKRELLKIAKDLDKENINETEARNLLLGLLGVSNSVFVVCENDNYARILHLNLKKHWFNLIATKVKPEEYREIKAYWVKRLLLDDNGSKLTKQGAEDLCEAIKYALSDEWKDTLISKEAVVPYDKIEFKNGYSKNAPTMVVELKGLKIGTGYELYGAEKDTYYFKLQLGEILFNNALM